MAKPKKNKPKSHSPKPRQTRKATPSSSAQKPIPPPKPQSNPSSGDEKRKKGKPGRVYVATTAEEEIESDEVVREVKKSATAARVVKMQPSGESQTSKKPKNDIDGSHIADSSVIAQDPLVIAVESEKNVEKVGNEKGEDTEMEEKEKDEGKVE
ncbi:uncharacterized protein LOC131037678 [Cryptomeria japonica]|uniref:uncharacterized protein LOC131037678 n=1 Tax=Cryptomeria japonica TaxID=3369 RepID=UPI0027DA218F|nr:uncharacterized protein LOC131037678 [Cryptomeria japonica]